MRIFINLAIISNFKFILCDPNSTIKGYEGEYFPVKYLRPDEAAVTSDDLDRYLHYFNRTVSYFYKYANSSDVNTGVGVFLGKAILKRTLLDDKNKLQEYQRILIQKNINKAENVLSHYIYKNSVYDWFDLEFRVTKLFQNDAPVVYSIGDFNRNRFNRWILDKNPINKFIKDFDTTNLSKETYVSLVEAMEEYSIAISDSDKCISRVAYNPEPIDLSEAKRCKRDSYCEKRLASDPSVAYTLSHRLLNIYFRVDVKRCYISSEENDKLLMDKLCANMYRETVYLARRGYFCRDIFLEHIALCALLGYQEFYRKHWFDKATSWITEEGCFLEFRNYYVNRSKLMMESAGDDFRQRQIYKQFKCKYLSSECDEHPTAVGLVVLAHAIRYAVRFMSI